MGRIWSDEGRFQRWLEVELAATDTLAEARHGAAAKRRRCFASARAFDVARINEIEASVKHDVIAFTLTVGETHRRSGRGALAALRPDFE